MGSGLRRVEALTGAGALAWVKEVLEERNRLAGILGFGRKQLAVQKTRYHKFRRSIKRIPGNDSNQ